MDRKRGPTYDREANARIQLHALCAGLLDPQDIFKPASVTSVEVKEICQLLCWLKIRRLVFSQIPRIWKGAWPLKMRQGSSFCWKEVLLIKLSRKLLSSLNRTEQYNYKKIKANSQIRLFSFRKTKQAETISIKVETFDIGNLPLFECISYTWGNVHHRKTILCDGRELTITENLWDALQRIRRRVDSKRRFWADQISINQNDLEEKGMQVGMMFTIFSNTTRVICWLGEEDDHTARAFEVLRMWNKSETNENLRLQLARLWSSDTGPETQDQLSNKAACK